MKKCILCMTVIFLLVLIGGCFDTVQEEKENEEMTVISQTVSTVIIAVSKETIAADGVDYAFISAVPKESNGNIVTSQTIEIFVNGAKLNTNKFRTKESGKYFVVAKVGNVYSTEVEINAYVIAKYRLSTIVEPYATGGINVSGYDQIPLFTSGTTIKLIPTSYTGYKFKEWKVSTGSAVNAENEVLMDTDKTVTAVFEKLPEEVKYTLNIVIEPAYSGSIIKDKAGSQFTSGSVISITASAVTGYRFKGWKLLDNTEIKNNQIIMTSDKTLVAQFEETKAKVELSNVDIKEINGNFNAVLKLESKNNVKSTIEKIEIVSKNGNYTNGFKKSLDIGKNLSGNGISTISALVLDEENDKLIEQNNEFKVSFAVTIKDENNNTFVVNSSEINCVTAKSCMNILERTIFVPELDESDSGVSINGSWYSNSIRPGLRLFFNQDAILDENKIKDKIKLYDITKSTEVAISIQTSGYKVKIFTLENLINMDNYRLIVSKGLLSENGMELRTELSYEFSMQIKEFSPVITPANGNVLAAGVTRVEVKFNKNIVTEKIVFGTNIVFLEDGIDVTDKIKYRNVYGTMITIDFDCQSGKKYKFLIKGIEGRDRTVMEGEVFSEFTTN